MRFKVGDIVKCIDDSNSEYIRYGHLYEVTRVICGFWLVLDLVTDNYYQSEGFLDHRFELYGRRILPAYDFSQLGTAVDAVINIISKQNRPRDFHSFNANHQIIELTTICKALIYV